MNVMTLDGYHAKIEYDAELDLFRGEILGLNGGANFYGKNPKKLRSIENIRFYNLLLISALIYRPQKSMPGMAACKYQ